MRWKFCVGMLGSALLMSCGSDNSGGEEQQPQDLLEDGYTSDDDAIIGGRAERNFAAVGALTMHGQVFCTGTVIGARKVLTAAHCLMAGIDAQDMQFVLGGNVSRPHAVMEVDAVRSHPAYDAATVSSDVGLVYLASDAPVRPMAIMSRKDIGANDQMVGQELVFVGYGVTKAATRAGAGRKRSVKLSVIKMGSQQFAYSTPGKNTCLGDSGGPALLQTGRGRYKVLGITSYGDLDCSVYGVNTRVDVFADFIESVGVRDL